MTRYDLAGQEGASRTSEWEALDGASFERLAISPDGKLMLAVDDKGRVVLSTVGSQHELGRLALPGPASCAAFAPCGRVVAVAVGRLVQLWRIPAVERREWLAFRLERTMSGAGSSDVISSLAWSPSGRRIAVGSADMTVRVLCLDAKEALEATGHRHTIVGLHWTGEEALWSVSREGVAKAWSVSRDAIQLTESAHLSLTASQEDEEGQADKDVLKPYDTRPFISSVSFRQGLLLAGFINGAFGLFSLEASPAEDESAPRYPALTLLHALSLGNLLIDACAVSGSGEWLAFGSAALGQLLVWEWRSEAYVLKQQGHVAPLTAIAFSPDGQSMATGGQDGRIKVWSPASGCSTLTFTEHKGAAVTALAFVWKGRSTHSSSSVLLSAATDGTVRAYDLIRGRAFRVMASPRPVRFSCLAVDPSGDVIAAGTLDTNQLLLWSLRTGDLLETIEGHEGPISCLAFDPAGTRLFSGSWDRSVRIWNVFARDRQPEAPLTHQHDVLALALRPDGQQLAVGTLGGDIALWDPEMGQQTGVIETKRDTTEGRLDPAPISSLAYAPDGQTVWAAGAFPWLAIYSAPQRLLLRKLTLSRLHQSKDKQRITGAKRNSEEWKSSALALAATGAHVALLTEQGVQLWRQAEGLLFDPVDLDTDCTPEAALKASRKGDHLRALLMAFRLGIPSLTLDIWGAVPHSVIPALVPALPLHHLPAALSLIAGILSGPSAELELALRWLTALLQTHGRHIKAAAHGPAGSRMAPALRAIHKACHQTRADLGGLANQNLYMTRILLD